MGDPSRRPGRPGGQGMSLLGLGEYGGSSEESTPASQKLEESPATQIPAASGADEQTTLKKSFSLVGYTEDGGADEGDDKGTPKVEAAGDAKAVEPAAGEPAANGDDADGDAEYAKMVVDPD